jgi:hypothetical protein
MGPGDQVYLINMKNYGYYLNGRWRADFVFERYQLENFLEKTDQPEQLAAFFKSRGITHLMMDENFLASPQTGLAPDSLRRFRDFIIQFSAPLIRYESYGFYRLK